MKKKSPFLRLLYSARNWRSRRLFRAINVHCRGAVLDVGGWDFFLTATNKGASFESWTVLEQSPERLLASADPRVRVVHGDGCRMDFDDESFDTVLNVQVLEHVFEPLRMIEELARVLKPGGSAILLVPATSTMHLAPAYYCNFSRYWLEEAVRRNGLEIVELTALGGIWSSAASHFFYFFLQSARVSGMSDPRSRRNAFFYVLYPLMALYALIGIPICLLLALGDLDEEPNNHLVVARKPAAH